MYGLTWIEILNLLDAIEMETDAQKGIRPSDNLKFEQFIESLE